MVAAVEKDVAQLRLERASLREEGIRMMWAADVERLTIELSQARVSAPGRADPTRDLLREMALEGERQRASVLLEEKLALNSDIKSLQLALASEIDRSNALQEAKEMALAWECQRTSALLKEKAARDSDIKSLQLAHASEIDRSNALREAKAAMEARSKQDVEALESMLMQLMIDFERVEATNRTLADEVRSLKNSGVVGSFLILDAEKKQLMSDFQRIEAKNRTLADEVLSLKNSEVVDSSLTFAAEKTAMLMTQETEVMSLRKEGELVRKMWAADVDRLTVELSQARAFAPGRADPTRELLEMALAGLEEKVARDPHIKSLQSALASEPSSPCSFYTDEEPETEQSVDF